MQLRRINAFHSHLRTSDVSLCCQNLFGTRHWRTVPFWRSRKITVVPRRSLNLFGPFPADAPLWPWTNRKCWPIKWPCRRSLFVTIFVFRPQPHMHRPEGFGPSCLSSIAFSRHQLAMSDETSNPPRTYLSRVKSSCRPSACE